MVSGYSPVTISSGLENPCASMLPLRYSYAFFDASRHFAAKSASYSLYRTDAFAITAVKSPVAVFEIGHAINCAVSFSGITVSGNTSQVTLWYTPPLSSCILSIQSSSYLASSKISGTPFPLSGIPISSALYSLSSYVINKSCTVLAPDTT